MLGHLEFLISRSGLYHLRFNILDQKSYMAVVPGWEKTSNRLILDNMRIRGWIVIVGMVIAMQAA